MNKEIKQILENQQIIMNALGQFAQPLSLNIVEDLRTKFAETSKLVHSDELVENVNE